MTDPRNDFPGAESGFKPKSQKDFLNYFGKDRWIHAWLAEKRTRLISAVVPPLRRLGLVPDTISYLGIALLAGVVMFFVRQPLVAVLFLVGHIIADGVDGAYARHTKKASQSGAFTDLVCDQLGMVVVSMMAIFHHFVPPLLGTVYISLYLIVVVFGVLINVLGLGSRITITSKYFLYAVYGIWAAWGVNYFSALMYFFSTVMAFEVVVGYLRLKRGIRKKYDAEVRFSDKDQYSSRLNYALNVAVPAGAFLLIIVGANIVPIRAMLDRPSIKVHWQQGPVISSAEENLLILGLANYGDTLLVLLQGERAPILFQVDPALGTLGRSFVFPGYLDPAFPVLFVDKNQLLVADRSTRLFMGIDIEESFHSRRAVIVLTLPLQHLAITAAGSGSWKDRHVWLIANYLYTRKTYVVDPGLAYKRGSVLDGEVASYTNGGFPSGLTVVDNLVFEFNKSPLRALIYMASLKTLLEGVDLLEASKAAFSPPVPSAVGPVRLGEDLVMLGPDRRIYRLPLRAVTGRAIP
ncbi:MAG: CDP-alcohol phosphatidyltransferase family protein [Thermodesulfobacteriota bacterium]